MAEIDKVNNASKLVENVKVERVGEGMLIKFPSNMDFTKISGVVYFQRWRSDFEPRWRCTESRTAKLDRR